MLISLVTLVFGSACDLLSLAFLARFALQWARVPFANPPGRFVIAVTDWAIRPARRLVPGMFGLDVASLLLAWLAQCLFVGLLIGLTGLHGGAGLPVVVVAALAGLVETIRLALYLAMLVIFVAVIFSWINPHAPMAPLFDRLAAPMLRPLQRLIPNVGGFDLSPLVVLLLLQVALLFANHARGALLPFVMR